MTKINPLDRYTASQALKHPYINQQERVAPLTTFEKFKIYLEELKFKGIVYSILFASIIKPFKENTNDLIPENILTEMSPEPPLRISLTPSKYRSESPDRRNNRSSFSSSFVSLSPDSQTYLRRYIKIDGPQSKKIKKKPALPRIRGLRPTTRTPISQYKH